MGDNLLGSDKRLKAAYDVLRNEVKGDSLVVKLTV